MSFFKRPRSLKYLPQINIILSPSTISPFSSTAIHLSPSPSKATPTCAPFSTTNFANASGWVEPTPLLILSPSGFVAIVSKSAPKSANKRDTNALVDPLAPSTAMCIPSKSSGIVCSKNCVYFKAPSR